jgi:hypothetical protein
MSSGDASKDIFQMLSRGLRAPLNFDALPDALSLQDRVDAKLLEVFEGSAVFFVEPQILLCDDDPVIVWEAILGVK